MSNPLLDISHILIIDGNLQHRRAIAGLLVRHLRHAKISVYDPDRDPALGLKFRWWDFELVIMDVGNQSQRAQQWFQKISEAIEMPPVIFLHMACNVDTGLNFIRLGALDYICKKKLGEKRFLKALSYIPGVEAEHLQHAKPAPKQSETPKPAEDLESTLQMLNADSAMAKAVDRSYEESEDMEHTQQLPDISKLKAGLDQAMSNAAENIESGTSSSDDEKLDFDSEEFKPPFTDTDIFEGTAELGEYRIQACIGKGGTASVYRASRKSDNKIMALKLCVPEVSNDPTSRDRFMQEFDLLQNLNHPNIVQMDEKGVSSGRIYIVMELLPALDLKQRIQSGLPLGQIINFTAQISAALYEAHQNNIIHRDLKPTNILFREDGSLALVDFGIAKLISGHNHIQTTAGMLVGTPSYVSPEQAMGNRLDERTDLYTLGVILYEMMERQKPFTGPSSMDVMYAHVNSPVPELTNDWGELGNIVIKLLEKEPADRFGSGLEVLHALQRAYPEHVNSSLFKASWYNVA